jgi:hypothetical protein
MPWKLRKAPKKDLYWVINKETGKKHSKEPLPKERAEAQMRALYANVPDAEKGGFSFPKGFHIDKGRPNPEMWSYDYLNKKGGAKYKWGDIPLYFDDMNGSGVLDTLKNKYKEIKDKGAAFLTGTNYVGPFNRLDDEYIRTHPPTDKIDEGAMKHDLEYSRIAKLRKAGTPKEEIERLIRVSDDAFLDNIKKHWRTNPRAAAMGYAGIKGKNVVEDVAGLDRNLFVGEGMKKGGANEPYDGYWDEGYYSDDESERDEKEEVREEQMPDNEKELYIRYFTSLWRDDPNHDEEWNHQQFSNYLGRFMRAIELKWSFNEPITIDVLFNAFRNLVINASPLNGLYPSYQYGRGKAKKAMKGGMKTPSGFEVSLLPNQRVRIQSFVPIFPMDIMISLDDSREVLRDFLEGMAPVWMDKARQLRLPARMANPFFYEGELWDAIQQLRQQTTTDADPAPETTRTGEGKKGRGACVSASAERDFPPHDPNEPGNAVDVLTQLYLEAKRQNPQMGASPQNITRFARGFQHQMNPIPNLTQAEEQSVPFRLGGDAYFKHCHMAGMGKMSGRGFFGDFWNAGKQFAERVVERVKQTGESIVNVVRGKAPRLDLPPKVRQLLGAYGNRPIVRMFVRRDPIQSAIDTALNFISIGSWNSLKQKYGYDTFYHLQLEVIVRVSDSDDTNARFVLQKNEVIDVSPAQPSTDKTEMVEVPMSEGHTMNSLLSNAKQTMGEKFYYYDAFHNNCQDFVGALLSASGLMRPDVAGFIKQPVDQLVQEISMTDRIARGITDLGGIVDVGLQGKGGLHPKAAFAAQLKEAGVSPSAYLEMAKKKANALGLAANMLGFSSDDKHKLQIPNADGKMIRFGAVGLGDYILYTLQKNPEAEKHRKAYLARATKIKGDWAKDPYSANSLAIGVLW